MKSVTITVTGQTDESGSALVPQLFLVLECDRPLAPPSRHSLLGVHEVSVGRGARGASRSSEGEVSRLDLRVPDAQMSQVHARVLQARGHWILEDAGSKNRTLINGAPVRRAVLLDGDLIEMGHTMLLFRDALPLMHETRPDLDGQELAAAWPIEGLATFSATLATTFASLATVAPSTVPVMLRGESGTGKEVVARALHALSGRAGPFVPVNCGALPAKLVEATLFGHRRGSFSGAVEDRPGLLRSAEGGTLFLDEIGDLPLAAQTVFLRVLQEKEVTPLGETRPVPVDVRLVTATHRPLDELVQAESFRADLYARMTGLTVRLPRLAERHEDLGLLIGAILRRLGRDAEQVSFQLPAARALFRHDWPLNIRELERCLATAVVLARGGAVKLEHLPEEVRPQADDDAPQGAAAGPGDDARLKAELVALLERHQGNVSEVARVMGKARMQVHRWLKRFGLELESFRR